jgi:hypothetical protein
MMMLDRADIGLLGCIIVVLSVAGIWNYRGLKRERAVSQKYLLYAVRDEFVLLVANGRLPEDGFLFQRFYKAVNYLIAETNTRISLRNFINGLEMLEEKGLDPASPIERTVQEVKKIGDPQVTKAVVNFFVVTRTIILENSLAARLTLHKNAIIETATTLWKSFNLPNLLFPILGNTVIALRRYQRAITFF